MQPLYSCPKCHQYVQYGQYTCPACGSQIYWQAPQPITNQSEPSPGRTTQRQSTITVQQTEPTYYSDDKGVRVTTTRLIIGDATYAMANISSIKTAREGAAGRIAAGIICVIVGAVLLMFAISNNFSGLVGILGLLGVVCLVVGVVCFCLKTPYKIQITSASSETAPLESNNKEYIDQIVRAVNEALIQRG